MRPSAIPVFVLMLAAACIKTAPDDVPPPAAEPDPLDTPHAYVGGAACVECHAEQAEAWRRSHHARSMASATPDSVLGDFDGAEFTYNGVTSVFSRRGDDFFVRTEGPDGALTEFPIAYTFGVEPLQQLLIRLKQGRLQALSIAWDSRPPEEGGQRWYHLYPDQSVDATDVLHWTKPSQNWNARCADCHSTRLKKGYDAKARTYATTFSDVNVSCESCHGPGARHVAWASQHEDGEGPPPDAAGVGLRLDLGGSRATYVWNEGAGKPVASGPSNNATEVDMCGRCHARRGALSDDYHPGDALLDHYRVALLDRGLYHADGQIDDEVFVYGSFLQSRMHQAGVACTHCHDPHTQQLRIEGNAICTQCHDGATYDASVHHHHEADSDAAQCVSCHMPAKVYMGVDARRDHSFRVPNPALSAAIGTPNACSDCHANEGTEWAANAVEEWFGAKDRTHFGAAFAAADARALDAEPRLLAVIDDEALPGIVRATAVARLAATLTQRSFGAVGEASRDPDPLVRLAATYALDALPPDRAASIGRRLLRDPVRVVRAEAAARLVRMPARSLGPTALRDVSKPLAEYRAMQEYEADRAEGLLNLANLALASRDFDEARRLLERAHRIAPDFNPATINLADILRAKGNEDAGRELLEDAVERHPDDPNLHRALGLSRVRSGARKDGVRHLARAYALSDEPIFAFTYAVALNSTGHPERALEVLERAHDRAPGDVEVLSMLVSLHRDEGHTERARFYAQRLQHRVPEIAADIERMLNPPQ